MSFGEQLDYNIKQPMFIILPPAILSSIHVKILPETIAKNQSSTTYHMKLINCKINILHKLLLKERPCWLMEMSGFLH